MSDATDITLADTPIRELVSGLDDIAELAIPYAQLPRRARTAYAADFARWSDIADETRHSLMSRPKVGERTVRSLLAAAADAVNGYRAAAESTPVGPALAVQRLLDRLDERDRKMLSARVWTGPPQTQPAVAHRLGVHKAWVHRNQPRAEAHFAELLADPAHREVGAAAAELRRRLGPYLPAGAVATEMRRLKLDPSSEAARVLLYLAGPYVCRDEWCENTASAGRQLVAAAADAVFDRSPAPPAAALAEALAAAGMTPESAAAYLAMKKGLRRCGDVWVRWAGSAADKAESVLRVRGTPATPEDVFAQFGDHTTLATVRDALSSDGRFVRATRQTWGLRAWGLDEYGGVFDAIAARIDAAGGELSVAALVADLVSSFPDVAQSSIRINLNTLAFVVADGRVRRRTDADEWPPVGPLRSARGAFRNGRNEIRLAVVVTAEMLRGSGGQVLPAVATALGVGPGQRREFTGPQGSAAVTWRLSTTNGPSIGSLRPLALATGAALGDTLVLAFGLADGLLTVARIGADICGMPRLSLLLGRPVRSPGAELAASLDCRRADVAAVLRDRGDADLADLVPDWPGRSTDLTGGHGRVGEERTRPRSGRS